MQRFAIFLLFAGAALALSGPAMAYVGPGAGISLVGALIGLAVAVVTALGVVLFWPVRALMKKMKTAQAPGGARPAPASEGQESQNTASNDETA